MKKKYRQVKVNLDPADAERLSEIAAAEEISLAELFRRSVGAAIERPPARKSSRPAATPTDPALLYALAKIGANLNQIARRANGNRAVDRAVLSQLVEIERALKELLP